MFAGFPNQSPLLTTNYAIDLETLHGTPFPGAARVYG